MRILLLFCLLFAAAACQKKTAASPSQPQKPLILVSISPYRSLVERVAGDGYEVQSVVPMGANPHSFEPTSQEVAQMQRAAIWFCIGEPFEAKIAPILQRRNPSLLVVDLRKGIPMIEEGSISCHHCGMDHFDRHIWLSPRLASLQVGHIEEALRIAFQADFTASRDALQQELAALDVEIKNLMDNVSKRTIVVSHPAFGYFCKDYAIEQLSVEYEGKDPRPKQLEETLHRAVVEGAGLALALPQYNNKGAQMIADQLHVPIRFIDPYSPDYFATMRKLAQLIAESQHD
jgi:zinc transport system substrate-binding protein